MADGPWAQYQPQASAAGPWAQYQSQPQTPPPAAPDTPTAKQGDTPIPNYLSSSISALKSGAQEFGRDIKESVAGAPQRYLDAAKPYGKNPLGVVAGVANAVGGAPTIQKAMDAAPGLIGAGEGVPEAAPRVPEGVKPAELPKPEVSIKPVEAAADTPKAPWEQYKQMERPLEEKPVEAPHPAMKYAAADLPPEIPREPQAVGAEAAPKSVVPGEGRVTHGDVIRTEDEMTKVRQNLENITTRGRQAYEQMPEELRTPEAQRRMYQYGEDNPAHGASPTEKAAFDKYIQPFRDEAKQAYDDIKGMLSKEELDDLGVDDPNYMSRKVVGHSSKLDRASGQAMGEGGGGNYTGSGRYVAPAEKGRTYFVTGPDRQLVHVKGDKVYKVGPDETESLMGKKGEVPLQNAYASEIEASTDTRYHQHALASTVDSLTQMTRARDELNVARKLKADFAQAGVATPLPKVARKLGWQQPDLPGWKNVYVEPRLKAALDKFAPQAKKGNVGEFLSAANRVMQNTLFINPIAHMRNQFASVMIDRGFANVTSAKFFKYLKEANDDVEKQTPFAQEALAKGAGLRYPSAANQKFFDEMMKGSEEALKDPGILSLAKSLGARPLDLYNSYMNWANKSLWHHSDTMLLARIKEKMDINKLSLDDAIKEVHDQVADYRIPSEAVVPGKAGRLISQTISGPYANAALAFTRWHYNTAKMLVMPAVNAAKGAMAVGKEGAAAQVARRRGVDAVGQMVAGAVAYNVLMGVGDQLVQKMSGDPNARMGAWGPMAYVRLVDDLVHGRIDSSKDKTAWVRAATAGLFAPSPLVQLFMAAVLGKDYKFDNLHVDKKKGETELGARAKTAGEDLFAPAGMIKDTVANPGRALAEQTLGAGRKPQADKPKALRSPYIP